MKKKVFFFFFFGCLMLLATMAASMPADAQVIYMQRGVPEYSIGWGASNSTPTIVHFGGIQWEIVGGLQGGWIAGLTGTPWGTTISLLRKDVTGLGSDWFSGFS
jgi:hypothetical protein